MKIAIIGAGNVGTALATSMTHAGHSVTIASKHPESATKAAQATGAATARRGRDAVAGAEVVVLAVPYVAAGEDVATEIGGVVAGKTVVDATNPLKADGSGLATEGTSAAEEFQRRLPEARVVKAFNTILASNQARPDGDIDAFVAGDDEGAKRQVTELIESMGFAPLDVGPLSAARHLEGMAFINIGLNAANGWNWSSAWKLER